MPLAASPPPPAAPPPPPARSRPRIAAHAQPKSAPAECACAAEVHRGPVPLGAVRGAAVSGASTARRGGIAGPSAPSPHLGPGASFGLSLAHWGWPGRPGRRRGGSSARARATPAPPPPGAARWAGAPRARRGSRAAGASGEGAPDPRSAGMGAGSGAVPALYPARTEKGRRPGGDHALP